MKKFYSILLCLLAFKSVAQTEPAGLFDMTDESLFGESTEQVFTGKPIVLIEKQVQPQKQIIDSYYQSKYQIQIVISKHYCINKRFTIILYRK